MADASPTSTGDGDDRSRSGRSRPRRRPAVHEGDRCAMCRRTVVVDARGRCPLGHQVVPIHVVEQRREDRGQAREASLEDAAARAGQPGADRTLVATYIEPRTADPTPPPHVAPQGAPDARPAFDDPPPPVPSAAGAGQPDVTPPPALPVRPRGAAGPEPARSLFRRDDAGGAAQPAAARPHAARSATDATSAATTAPAPTSVLEEGGDGSGRSPSGRIVVPLTDLTPDAPSALDIDEAPAARLGPDPDGDAVFEQEPMTDPGLEPARGVLQMIAGGVFVAILLAVAWYLATSL